MNDNNFIKGFLSGAVQTLSGHPLDTIKVLSQNKKTNPKNIFSKNITKYYRGVYYPLVLNSFIVGIQFNTFYSYGNLACGLTSGLILTPFDYYKTYEQVNNKRIIFPKNLNQLKNFNFPRGYNITILRETIALSIYFNSYEYMKKNNLGILFSGGMAGCLSWLFSYPIDTIKTRFQLGYSYKESFYMGNLWRGLSVTLGRAWIVNSLGFYFAELIK